MDKTNETLYGIQSTELEILKYFDEFCRENDIKYSLSGGTLLGAIRHKGFIPWDDDVDCMVMREDYDKLFELWNDKADTEKYFLQNKENSNAFSQSFAKIRKNHTTFLQEDDVEGAYHHGLFIDIMPADRIPNGTIKRKLFYLNVMLYQLFNREFAPPLSSSFVQFGCNVILFFTKHSDRAKLRAKYLKKLTKYDDDRSLEIVSFETVSSMHRHYSPDLMDKFIDVPFEDTTLKVTSKWQEVLETGYGDYMQFPPKEEQIWKHHPILINFEKDYNELKKDN